MAITYDKLAVGSFHYIRYPFTYFLDSAVRLGVKNIEIWGVAPHVYADDVSPARARELEREIASRDLNPVCYCPEQCMYPVDIGSTDDVLRCRSVDFLSRSIELGAALGAPLFLLCPGRGWLDAPIEPAWDACRRSIETLVRTAEREKVTIVIETQKTFDTTFMLRAADQRRMIDEIGSPWFKAMVDTTQMTVFGDTPESNMRILGDDLRHMHLTALYAEGLDLSLEGDALLAKYPHGRPVSSHMIFENGNNPIVRYLRQFDKLGYDHYVTIEICTRPSYITPEKHVRDAIDMLKQDFFMMD